MSKPLTRRERSVAAKYRKWLKAQKRATEQYALADNLAYAIAEQLGGDQKVVRVSSEGNAIRVVDNYLAAIRHPKREPKQMPKAWAHGCVRQFDIEETTVAS